jgi:putative SOS response-associated peptidase YedK
MCYSAMVEQRLKSLGLRFKARIDTPRFEDLFQRRLTDEGIKIGKALEANFDAPETPAEREIKRLIDEYRTHKAAQWEAELFKQKKRLADAERTLKVKDTKKAREDQRIAGNKIDWYVRKLAELRRPTPEAEDARIFPFWFAPVVVAEGAELVIRPMRYHCRPNGKPAWYDKRYDGLYNARRDSLQKFWKDLFGHRHAFMVVSSFFENVALHDFEHRELRPEEKEQNLVLHFNPRPAHDMLVACLWDHWESPGEPDLYSFAAITDDPPPEVAATGHNRCLIPLRPDNLSKWLNPEGLDKTQLDALLDDRERPYYEHELAA